MMAGDAGRRKRLAQAIAALWAPLDEAGAGRPVLAIWLEEPNWRCPVEAAPAICASAPLSRLPVRWRAVTVMALGELFGADLASLRAAAGGYDPAPRPGGAPPPPDDGALTTPPFAGRAPTKRRLPPHGDRDPGERSLEDLRR